MLIKVTQSGRHFEGTCVTERGDCGKYRGHIPTNVTSQGKVWDYIFSNFTDRFYLLLTSTKIFLHIFITNSAVAVV